MQNLLKELSELLSKDERLSVEGKLLKNKVIELALSMDATLIKLLLKNNNIKKHFFTEVDGILVFDKIKFQRFVSNKEFLPDSYTAFKNKIGLVNENGDYLSESREVVLAWPYKDCVLEGGQTKEDQKRDEIFWNETLAPDEIDSLLAPKVFTNWVKYELQGKKKLIVKNTIDFKNENIIIRGNNLLGLFSLYMKYAEEVKLIYIDPPFNTGNDSFQYNDSFNHSTWLSFEKNRLEISKKLLSKDGSIWINIDDNELVYLKVLCDEIFGRHNYISTVAVKRSAPTGHKAINPSPISVTDYIIGYAKNKALWNYKITYVKREIDTAYNQFIENYEKGPNKWVIISLKEALKKYKLVDANEAINKYPERVIRFAEPNYDGVGKETKDLINKSKSKPAKILIQERDDYQDIYLLNGQRILFYKDKLREIDGEIVTSEPLTNYWTDIPFQGIAKEGGVILKKGKKPEFLIRRLLDFATETNDLVLDYNLGSGTTCAVAHKMGRKYIGIEQLDYGDNDSITRLQNVINNDQSGISKAVKWKGGGSFIYCELMELNEAYINKIKSRYNKRNPLNLGRNAEKAFISYKLTQKYQ